MFAGLPSRLEKDVRELRVENMAKGDKSRADRFKLKIEDAPRRKNILLRSMPRGQKVAGEEGVRTKMRWN